MFYSISSTPKVSDLVLDPFAQSDTLGHAMRQGLLADEAAEELAHILPTAIAQLEAIGDAYGAIALATLSEQLDHLAIA